MKLTISLAGVALAGVMVLPGAAMAQQPQDTAVTRPTGRIGAPDTGRISAPDTGRIVAPETGEIVAPDSAQVTGSIAAPDSTQVAGSVAPDTTARDTTRVVRQARRVRRPRIQSALRALYDAREDLQNAAHTFGGHRYNALRAVDAAIAQLKLALKYDRTH